MIITSLDGQSEMLADYQIKERKRVVNGEYSLPFIVFKTNRNEHSFPLVQEESIVEYDGQKYRIKKIREYMKGQTPVKEATAQHEFFDIIDKYQYNTLSGTINMVQALNHVFGVTDWTWVNQGAFASVEFDNFGDGTALELFKIILERYGAEFEITGPREVTLKNQIGSLKEEQFRYRHNIKTLYKDIDSSNVSTYIKGFGKKNEDGTYAVTAEYTSPNASAYGIRHASPVRDERFTTQAGLLENLQKVIQDTPDITIQIDLATLGIDADLGDTIYLIHEDLGIDATVRVLEFTDYPETYKSPTVVLSNFKKTLTSALVSFSQTSKAVKQLTDADGNLSLALKKLYRNSNHYSDSTGDWYISPDDSNAYVHIGAGGLDVHKGLVRVERDDGYATIIGGIIQNDFAIVGGSPPFTATNVSVEGYFWSTTSNIATDCDYYTFLHNARYLKVWVALYASNAVTGSRISVQDSSNVLAAKITYNTDPNSDIAVMGEVLTIDLGVPTGEMKSIYVRLNTGGTGGNKAYGRVIRMWKEG